MNMPTESATKAAISLPVTIGAAGRAGRAVAILG